MLGTRIVLIFSNLSPVFILWAIRGVEFIPDTIFIPACLAVFLIPNIFLFWLLSCWNGKEHIKNITIESSTETNDHILTYLIAIILPLYGVEVESYRDLAALISAFIVMVFIFYHANLHYTNIILAILGYRIFEGTTKNFDQELTRYTIISRESIVSGKKLAGLRLGGNVLCVRKN